MAHFYVKAGGNNAKTVATRMGHARTDSGTWAQVASWDGAVETENYVDEKSGLDCVRVRFIKWQGNGTSRSLYEGPINPSLSNMRKYNRAHR